MHAMINSQRLTEDWFFSFHHGVGSSGLKDPGPSSLSGEHLRQLKVLHLTGSLCATLTIANIRRLPKHCYTLRTTQRAEWRACSPGNLSPVEAITLGTATVHRCFLCTQKLSLKLRRMGVLGNLHSLCALGKTFSFLDVTRVHSAMHSLPVMAHTAALS